MSSKQSNLTKYGYNLVCATTQDAINSTMKYYLDSLNGGIDWYEVYDTDTDTTVSVTPTQFQATCNVDPFSIPDGSTCSVGKPTGEYGAQLNTLYDAGFVYGIQAATGINDLWNSVPDIVVMDVQGTTVKYQMYFKTMAVVELQENRGKLKMVNCTQPIDTPWIYTYIVNLALAEATSDNKAAPLPQSGIFSVQQLYLELNKLVAGTTPNITGVSPECANFVATYVNAYVKSIPPGQSVVGYVQVLKPSNLPPSSLVVTTLQYAVLLDKTNPNLTTLNYLCMSGNVAAPPQIQYFPWDWVVPGEQTSGIMAINRNTFANYLINDFNQNFSCLSVQTKASVSYKDSVGNCSGQCNFQYTFPSPDPAPATWVLNTDTSSKTLATASFRCDFPGGQHSYSSNCTQGSISADWDYSLDGTLIFSNGTDGVPHVIMTLHLFSPAHAHFCGKSEDKNVVDITQSIDYVLSVGGSGQLIVTPNNPAPVDKSQTMSQLNTNCGKMTFDNVNKMEGELRTNLNKQISAYQGTVQAALSGATSWFFPGADTFSFKNVSFSDYGDLIVEIVYTDPT